MLLQLRRAESRYALERMGVSVTFSGGALDGLQRMIPVRVGLTWFSRLADVPLIESIIWAHKLASLQLAI